MTTRDEGGSPDRPTGEPLGERRRPTAPRQGSAVAAARTGAEAPAATSPGLVVTEERLADGRAITYFEVPR